VEYHFCVVDFRVRPVHGLHDGGPLAFLEVAFGFLVLHLQDQSLRLGGMFVVRVLLQVELDGVLDFLQDLPEVLVNFVFKQFAELGHVGVEVGLLLDALQNRG